MADVKKLVQIAIEVTGLDKTNISNLAKVFEQIKIASTAVNTSLLSVKDSLDKIKAPKGLTETVEALKGLKEIKGAANLKKVSDALQTLGTIKNFPKFGTLISNIVKLNDVDGSGLRSMSLALQKLSAIKISNISTRLHALNNELGKLSKQGSLSNFAKFASDLGTLQSALGNSTRATVSAQAAFSKLGTTIEQAQVKTRTFMDAIRTVSQFRVISEILKAFAGAMREGVTVIKDFDQALKDLQAITGATNFEVGLMGEKILDVASKTKFSATEVSDGMKVIAQSGFTASESINTMQAAADLATGTLSDMGFTVDLITTTMRVFNIDASRSGEVADTFANAVNKSKLTIEKLRTAMNYLGPIAEKSGITFQELSAAMGTLANQGIKASTIGTGLRTVLALLANPTSKLEEAARGAGVALADLDPQTAGLGNVISNLGLIVQDTGVAFDLFGKRGSTAVLALTEGQGKFGAMLDGVSRSGTAAEQAAKQMEGLGVSFKNLLDKLGILAIAVGNAGLTSALRVLVNVSRTLVDVLIELTNTTVGGLVVSLGLATLAFATLNQAIATTMKFNLAAVVYNWGLSLVMATGLIDVATSKVVLFQVALGPIYWAIVAVTAALVAGGAAWAYYSDASKDASEDAQKLAISMSDLSKKITDYSIQTAGLKTGSKQLKDANLLLRADLFEISKGYDDVAIAALKVVQSINPVTGAIKENSTAIQAYQDLINKKEMDALSLSLEKSVESLKANTSGIKRWIGAFVTDVEKGIVLLKGIWAGFIAYTTLQWDKLPGIVRDTFDKIRNKKKGYDAYLDFSDILQSNTKTWKEMSAIIESWDPKTMTNAQEKAKEAFRATAITAQKTVDNLIAMGKVNLNGTIEDMTSAAKATGKTAIELKAIVDIFEEMKKVQDASTGFENVVDKWVKEGDYKRFNNIIDAFNRLDAVKDKYDKKTTDQYRKEIEAHVNKMNLLEREEKFAILTGTADVAFYKEQTAKKIAIDKEARETQKRIADDSALQKAFAYKRANEDLKIEEDKLNAKFKDNAKDLGEELFKLQVKHNNRIAKILRSDEVTPADRLKAYKADLIERTAAHSAFMNTIDLEVAKGIKTFRDGEDAKKLASLQFYADALVEAKKYFSEVSKEDDPDEFMKRKNVYLEAERKYTTERGKFLVEYNREATKAAKDIEKIETEAGRKRIKALDKRKAAILVIENDLATKLEKINTKRIKVEEKFADQRVKIAQKAAQKILDIEEDADDKINGIKRRDESPEEKQSRDKKEAQDKLFRGEKLVAEALAKNDLEQLKAGEKLIKQSQDLAEGLTNQRNAIRGVEDAENALKKAVEAEKRIRDSLSQEKEKKALEALDKEEDLAIKAFEREKKRIQEVYAKKLKSIKDETEVALKGIIDTHRVALDTEADRHRITMGNLKAEADKRKQINDIASGNTDSAGAKTVAKSTIPESSSNTYTGNLLKALEAEKEITLELAKLKKEARLLEVSDLTTLTQAQIDSAQEAADKIKDIHAKAREQESANLEGYYDGISETNLKLLKKIAKDTTDTVIEANTEIKESLEGDLDIQAEVTIDKPENLTKEVEVEVDKIKPEVEVETKISAEIENEQEVITFKDSVEAIPAAKSTEVIAVVTGAEDVGELKATIDTLENKSVEAEANAKGEPETKSLISTISSLLGKTVDVIAKVSGVKELLELKKYLDDLKSKTINIDVRSTNVAAAHGSEGGLTEDIPRFAKGGQVFRRLAKRFIGTGSGTKDDVPALLMKGEYVLKKSAVEKLGVPFLEDLNNLRLNASSLIPRFAKGGFVGNMNLNFPGFMSMKKKLEELLNPLGLTNGISMKVGDPSFTDHMTDRVSKVSTPMGVTYAKSIMGRYTDGIKRMASGGEVPADSTFTLDKQALEKDYNAQIAEAKNEGRLDYAQVLEDEKKELLLIAKELEESLAVLKEELAEEIRLINEELKVTTASLKEQYQDTIKSIDVERLDSQNSLNKQSGAAHKALRNSTKELDQLERTATGLGMRFPGGGASLMKIANEHFKNVNLAIKKIPKTKEEVEKAQEAVAQVKQARTDTVKGFVERETKAKTEYLAAIGLAKENNKVSINEAKSQYTVDVGETTGDSKEKTKNVKDDATEDKESIKQATISTISELKKEYRDALLELEKKWHRSSIPKSTPKFGDYNMPYPRFADGGPTFTRKKQHIPGSGTKDDVPALLMKGEYVLRKEAVKKFGVGFLDKLNWGKLTLPRFADGGEVLTSNMADVIGKINFPKSVMESTPEGGGLASNPQAQEIIKHQLTFTLGNKQYGPFQGEGMTMESFIKEMKIAQARA